MQRTVTDRDHAAAITQISPGPEGRVLMVQYHDVKGSDLEQWKNDSRQTILWPPQYATGKAIYPYAEAKK